MNLLASLGEDLDAAQMMMDGHLKGDAKGHAEASVERLKRDLPSADTRLACELGKLSCEVSLNGDTFYLKARRL